MGTATACLLSTVLKTLPASTTPSPHFPQETGICFYWKSCPLSSRWPIPCPSWPWRQSKGGVGEVKRTRAATAKAFTRDLFLWGLNPPLTHAPCCLHLPACCPLGSSFPPRCCRAVSDLVQGNSFPALLLPRSLSMVRSLLKSNWTLWLVCIICRSLTQGLPSGFRALKLLCPCSLPHALHTALFAWLPWMCPEVASFWASGNAVSCTIKPPKSRVFHFLTYSYWRIFLRSWACNPCPALGYSSVMSQVEQRVAQSHVAQALKLL